MPIRSGKASNPSKYIRDRSAKMRSEVLAHYHDFEQQTQVRVTPDEAGKAVRIVSFTRESTSCVPCRSLGRTYDIEKDEWRECASCGGAGLLFDIRIDCYDEETLKACEANRWALFCSHAQAAIEGMLEAHRRDEPEPTTMLLTEGELNESE